MKNFEFTLHFKLPPERPDPKSWLDALFEAGCDDATVGVGRLGQIALDFARDATTARKAVASAIADVERAIPKGAFIAADPDLVGLADIAALVGMTRQNLQKFATNAIKAPAVAFPPPVVLGNDAKWRLAEIEPWLQQVKPGALTPEKIGCRSRRPNSTLRTKRKGFSARSVDLRRTRAPTVMRRHASD